MFQLSVTERGNILLVHSEENWINAWIRLPEPDIKLKDRAKPWLEISFRDCNYPALNVQTIEVTDEDLAKHIRKEFGGGLWSVNKMNLAGVVNEDNEIIEDETEEQEA